MLDRSANYITPGVVNSRAEMYALRSNAVLFLSVKSVGENIAEYDFATTMVKEGVYCFISLCPIL